MLIATFDTFVPAKMQISISNSSNNVKHSASVTRGISGQPRKPLIVFGSTAFLQKVGSLENRKKSFLCAISLCRQQQAILQSAGNRFLRFFGPARLTTGPGLCHGIGGNAYCFVALYRTTKNPKYLYRAVKFANFICEKFSTLKKADTPYSLWEGKDAPVICFL